MEKRSKRDYQFELVLANGKSRKFETSDELYTWAQQNCKGFNPEDKLTLSEWFEKRNKK